MISTVGTFIWWSAWITGGNVTYYKWPTKEGTRYANMLAKIALIVFILTGSGYE
jgi:hypothetical protein